MFIIELLISRSGADPEVFERTASPRYLLYDAEHRAKTLLAEAKRRLPDNPPDGYRILDAAGAIVAHFSK
jgi:hypothetical protein